MKKAKELIEQEIADYEKLRLEAVKDNDFDSASNLKAIMYGLEIALSKLRLLKEE